MAEQSKIPHLGADALAGLFENPDAVLKTAKQAREQGFKPVDIYGPYPLHGMEEALGLKRSWIPYPVLVMGLLGMALAFLFMAWTSAIDWPINVGGKPFVSWPALVPITFAGMVLFAGFTNIISLLIACKLPRKQVNIIDPRITHDVFALVIDSGEAGDRAKISQLLKQNGAYEIKEIEQ